MAHTPPHSSNKPIKGNVMTKGGKAIKPHKERAERRHPQQSNPQQEREKRKGRDRLWKCMLFISMGMIMFFV